MKMVCRQSVFGCVGELLNALRLQKIEASLFWVLFFFLFGSVHPILCCVFTIRN